MSREIAEVLRAHTAHSGGLRFETSPDVICGIELRAHGRKIAWSVRDYLEGLETTLAEVLKGGAKGPDKEGSFPPKQEELDQEEQEKGEGPALGKE
jgi:F-type H+-transporting ATPase subunit b